MNIHSFTAVTMALRVGTFSGSLVIVVMYCISITEDTETYVEDKQQRELRDKARQEQERQERVRW